MAERQKLEGGYPLERYLFELLSMLKSEVCRSERLKFGQKGKIFCNISGGKVIFFCNFEPWVYPYICK